MAKKTHHTSCVKGNMGKPLKVAIISAVALLLLGASPAQAAYEIYTYGSGDFVAQVLQGVALVFSGNRIQALVKVILIVGLLVAILQPITSWLHRGQIATGYGGEGFIALIKQVLLAVLVVYVFILPKAEVAIIDRIDPAQNQVIGDVPLAQAVIAHAASVIGDTMGDQMESAFSMPGSLNFSQGGVGMGIKYIDSIYSIQPPSSSTYTATATNGALISQSLKEYFNQCVFPNFAVLDGGAGAKNEALHSLANSSDILASLAAHSALYGDPNITITAPTTIGTAKCSEVLPQIQSAWTAIRPDWLKEVETKVAGNASYNPINVGSGQMTLDVIGHYFPDAGDPFVVLQNIAVGNLMRDAAMRYGAIYGNSDTVADTIAERSAVEGWKTTARMFSSVVHVMRNVFEGLIYGLSVLLPIAVAAAGLAPLGMYIRIALWLQLWVPFYILLNLFGDMEMARSLGAIADLSDGKGPTVKTWQEVGEKAQLSLAYVGSLAFTVPMFAWGLLKGGEYAVSTAVHAMSSGSGAAQIAATTGGQVAGQGNINMGVRRISNDSIIQSTPMSSGIHFANQAGGNTAALDFSKMTGARLTTMGYGAGVTALTSSVSPFFGAGGTRDGMPNLNNVNQVRAEGSVGHADKMREISHTLGYGGTIAPMTRDFTQMNEGQKAATLKRISDATGMTPQESSVLFSQIAGQYAAVDTFTKENYFSKLRGLGFGDKQIGEVQSRLMVAGTYAAAQMTQKEHTANQTYNTLKGWGVTQGELSVIKALYDPNKSYKDNVTGIQSKIAALQLGDSVTREQVISKVAAAEGRSVLSVQKDMNSLLTRLDGGKIAQQGIGPDGRAVTQHTKDGFSSVTDNSDTLKVGGNVMVGNLAGTAVLLNDRKMLAASAGGDANIWTNPAIGTKTVENMTDGLYGSLQTMGQKAANHERGGRAGVGVPPGHVVNAGLSISQSYTDTATDKAQRDEIKARLFSKYDELKNNNTLSYEAKTKYLHAEGQAIKSQLDTMSSKGLTTRQINAETGPAVNETIKVTDGQKTGKW